MTGRFVERVEVKACGIGEDCECFYRELEGLRDAVECRWLRAGEETSFVAVCERRGGVEKFRCGF